VRTKTYDHVPHLLAFQRSSPSIRRKACLLVTSSDFSTTKYAPLQSFISCLRLSISSRNFKQNSVALVRKRTIPNERPPLVGEVSANFCGQRVSRGQRNGPPRQYSRFSRPEQLLFLPSSSSIILMRLSGPRSRPTTSQKIW
jgi:hypothetical protein